MARPFDPLTFIPSADVLRRRVSETEALADRFRILLDVAERIERTAPPADAGRGERRPLPLAAAAKGGVR